MLSVGGFVGGSDRLGLPRIFGPATAARVETMNLPFRRRARVTPPRGADIVAADSHKAAVMQHENLGQLRCGMVFASQRWPEDRRGGAESYQATLQLYAATRL